MVDALVGATVAATDTPIKAWSLLETVHQASWVGKTSTEAGTNSTDLRERSAVLCRSTPETKTPRDSMWIYVYYQDPKALDLGEY